MCKDATLAKSETIGRIFEERGLDVLVGIETKLNGRGGFHFVKVGFLKQ